ncbi:MAG: hypothetical protein D3916_09090 [Candidatus Electrothrix sp. MAN1_4]|nr:hypothetical protein [Candidatus Electrothrix sp. MAN1_4]
MIGQQLLSIAAVALLCSLGANFFLFFSLKDRYYNEKIRAVFPIPPIVRNDYNSNDSKINKRVILLGDSRIAQWNNLPKVDGVEFIRRGVSGETSAQLRLRLTQELSMISPNCIILQIGINDLVAIGIAPALEHKIVEQLKSNYTYMLEECGKKNIRVFLLTIIPPGSPPLYRRPFWNSRIPDLVEDINQWILNDISNKYNITVLKYRLVSID